MAKKTIKGTNPLAAVIMGSKSKKKETPSPAPTTPFDPTIPSRADAPRAKRSAELGLSAEGVRGAVGDPASVSNQQRLAIDVQRAGFGGDFVQEFKKKARQYLIESETGDINSPNFRNKDYQPTEGDVLAQAREMALSRAAGVSNPKFQRFLEGIVRTAFGGTTGTPARPQKSSKPRASLMGNPDGLSEEMISKIAASARERRPKEIALEGINDDVLRRDIEVMTKAIDEGDELLYNKTLRRFEQRLATNLVQSKKQSVAGYDRTASADANTKTREEQGRKQIYDDSSPSEPGSDTEGKVSTRGNIRREQSDVVKDALDVIAQDEGELNKFLNRFSDVDQRAVRKALERLKDDPTSDAGQMAKGDLLRALSKAMSIEGMVKWETINKESSRRAGRLAAPASPGALEIKEAQEGREGATRKAMQAIEAIKVGFPASSDGRRQMTSAIQSIVDGINAYATGRPSRVQVWRNTITEAAGQAAAGNYEGINRIRDVFRKIGSRIPERSIERQVGERGGSMPQIQAIMTGVGSRIRGGPSARRAQEGRNVLTGKNDPPVPPVSPDAPERRGDYKGGVVESKEAVDRATGRAYDPKTPAAAPRKNDKGEVIKSAQRAKPGTSGLPTQDQLSQAIDEYLESISQEVTSGGDRPYYSGKPQMTAADYGKASNLLVSRIRDLTKASKNELKKIAKARVPAVIRDANQLDSARARLAEIEKALKSGKANLQDIVRLERQIRNRIGSPDIPGGSRTVLARIDVQSTKRELENQIKVLEARLGEYGKAIADGAKRLKLGSRDVNVAVREAERAASNPQRIVMGQPRTPLQAPKKAKASKVPVPEGFVRSDSPLPEMFAPRRGDSLADLREVTGGEFSGGVREQPGRKMSEERKRARRKKKVVPRRREGTRTDDLRAISQSRNLDNLIQGLPR